MVWKCAMEFYHRREEGADILMHRLPQSLVQDCSQMGAISTFSWRTHSQRDIQWSRKATQANGSMCWQLEVRAVDTKMRRTRGYGWYQTVFAIDTLTYNVECMEQRSERYISDLWSFFRIGTQLPSSSSFPRPKILIKCTQLPLPCDLLMEA